MPRSSFTRRRLCNLHAGAALMHSVPQHSHCLIRRVAGNKRLVSCVLLGCMCVETLHICAFCCKCAGAGMSACTAFALQDVS